MNDDENIGQSLYMNPVMEHYECYGQISLFDIMEEDQTVHEHIAIKED